MLRGRAAKLCTSKSMPVSTSFPVAGQINFNGGITNPHASGKKRSPDRGKPGLVRLGGTSEGGTPITWGVLARDRRQAQIVFPDWDDKWVLSCSGDEGRHV